jgi:hypothetical protein
MSRIRREGEWLRDKLPVAGIVGKICMCNRCAEMARRNMPYLVRARVKAGCQWALLGAIERGAREWE